MKTSVLILLALTLLLAGCTTPFKKLDAHIPDGNWKRANFTGTGEVAHGKIEASGRKENGKWVRGKIKAEYNGFWLKHAELDLEVDETK